MMILFREKNEKFSLKQYNSTQILILFLIFSVELLLKATGDAPIISKKKWVVSPDRTIGWISEFIRKLIKLGSEERLVSFCL